MTFLGRNVIPAQLTDGLEPGVVRHGLSDGSWSLIDLLSRLSRVVGEKSRLDLAIWTASGADASQLHRLLESGRLSDVRMMVDRSFASRQPKSCEKLVAMWGHDALRVWSSHAKFAVFSGGDIECLVMFSANLNQNRRIENFTVWCDADMVREYRAMVEELWERQPAGAAFLEPRRARHDTRDILGEAPRPKPLRVDVPVQDGFSIPADNWSIEN